MFDYDWRIYSVNPNRPPQYIAPSAIVKDSLINEGCTIEGDIDHSVLFHGVEVGAYSRIKESVIMPDTVIGKNCFIEKAIVQYDCVIPDGTVIRPLDDEIILVTREMLSGLRSATN